jgi:hypothetical protein
MSKMAELAYDIEQLYIEGLHPTKICRELNIPLTMVYDWLESCNVAADEDVADVPQEEIYSPYYGA